MTSAAYDMQKVTLMTHMSCGAHNMRHGIAQKPVCTEVVKERMQVRGAQLEEGQ